MPKEPGKMPSGKAPPKPQDVGIAPDVSSNPAPPPPSKVGELGDGQERQHDPADKS